MPKITIRFMVLFCLVSGGFGELQARTMIEWDFRQGTTHGWSGNAQVAPIQCTPEGLIIQSTGPDPWIEGPAIDIPEGSLVRLTLRIRSKAGGSGQIFYGPSFVAERVRNFALFQDNQWHDSVVLIGDSMGPGTRFRLDPCHGEDWTIVQFIRVEALPRPERPNFQPPRIQAGSKRAVTSEAGPLVLHHFGGMWGNYTIQVHGRDMATGYTGEMIGIQLDEQTEWLKINAASVSVGPEKQGLLESALMSDTQGATWKISRLWMPLAGWDAFEVETTIQVNRDRDVVLLPWITLFPGAGSCGQEKHQGLFAGLEYLANESSSSIADINGPDHVRRIPDRVKITFPLMAIEQDGYYIGLIWEPSDWVAAGFDSPDTVFQSGAHAMWLSGPGIGNLRFPNDPMAHSPIHIPADQPIAVRARIIAGRGDSIIPAVQQYVRLQGLPDLPEFEGGLDRAVELLAHGWLDSAANRDWRFRHAVWGNSFGPAPAADAAMFMHWLASNTPDRVLAERLKKGVDQTLKQLPPGDPFSSSVSHVHLPVPPLLFGRVEEYVRIRKDRALAQLRQFDDQGRILFRSTNGQPDYASTHFADHANGLGGRFVADILEAATLCGDKKLIAEGLALLEKQTGLYANTVPRGAQTWEIPLHTPDILASAHMIRAYVYGYLLSDEQAYLEQARYWAWTGVPFVYLVRPTDGPVGPYATIAVLGATNWVAPVWFGQPVQWCGLVYGSALHLLADHDDSGPWRQLATGITRTGLQMTWPQSDPQRQGLLPDFFHLRQQVRDGPAINPGTVGAHAPQAFGQPPLYYMKKLKTRPWFLHAPCGISDIQENQDRIRFTIEGISQIPCTLLISGLDGAPRMVRCTEWSTNQVSNSFQSSESGLLTIPIQGKSIVEIERN
ncbi:MAG: hypothetical protein JW829_07960 [Pirellulales bacterium]|nr:hypothetical protein [Pirellulales bacterium]